MQTTFQINLAPGDFRMAKYVLPHQLAVWKDQVDEVLLVVDLHRSAGRFAEAWEEGKDSLLALIDDLEGVRSVVVDYRNEAKARVAKEWSRSREIPVKDFRGGPCYAYFYGLTEAQGRYVLHSDADMFFGGGSTSWFCEAINLMEKNPDILFSAPHSGPPANDGRIKTLNCEPDSRAKGGQWFDFMSTRLFLVDKERFSQKIGGFRPTPPNLRSRIKAWVEGNPPWDLPEHWMTRAMREAEMCRFEFLGTGNGMWSLHPPYRCEAFFENLPQLIEAVESGALPEGQLGCHDFNEMMVDWSEATEKLKHNRWWRRLLSW